MNDEQEMKMNAKELIESNMAWMPRPSQAACVNPEFVRMIQAIIDSVDPEASGEVAIDWAYANAESSEIRGDMVSIALDALGYPR